MAVVLPCTRCREDFKLGAQVCPHCNGEIQYGGEFSMAMMLVIVAGGLLYFWQAHFFNGLFTNGEQVLAIVLLLLPGIVLGGLYMFLMRNSIYTKSPPSPPTRG